MARNNNKKTIAIISLLAVAVVLFVLSAKFPNFFKKESVTSAFPGDYSNQISGRVTKVEGNTVTVEGTVRTSKTGSSNEIKKTVSFTILPATKFEKAVMELKQSAKPYTPLMTKGAGAHSDMAVGTMVVRLESQEDLFVVDHATALGIQYEIFTYAEVQPNGQ